MASDDRIKDKPLIEAVSDLPPLPAQDIRGRASEDINARPTLATARDIAKLVNPLLLHHPLTEEEPMPTFAFPFSPPEMDMGPRYGFVLHHVLALDDPMEGFVVEVVHA